jgi:hypothetical protein
MGSTIRYIYILPICSLLSKKAVAFSLLSEQNPCTQSQTALTLKTIVFVSTCILSCKSFSPFYNHFFSIQSLSYKSGPIYSKLDSKFTQLNIFGKKFRQNPGSDDEIASQIELINNQVGNTRCGTWSFIGKKRIFDITIMHNAS